MLQLYVGSLWHRDSEPFTTVASLTEDGALEALAEAEQCDMDETADMDDLDPLGAGICANGTHRESALTVARWLRLEHGSEWHMRISDLREGTAIQF